MCVCVCVCVAHQAINVLPGNLKSAYGHGALNFINQLAQDLDRGEEVTKSATGLLGDIIDVCGVGVGENIKQCAEQEREKRRAAGKDGDGAPFYIVLVNDCSESGDDEMVKIGLWTKKKLTTAGVPM